MRLSTITLTILSVLLPLAFPIESTAEDAGKDASELGQAQVPCFDTVEEVMKMSGRKGKVEQKAPCYVYFKTADGKGFYIGSPAAPAEVLYFLEVLQEGKSYSFPDAFLDYRKEVVREVFGPVSNIGWPHAIAGLANDESRFFGTEFVPCLESTFFYAGDAASFNRFLNSAGKSRGTQLVIHPGSRQVAPKAAPQFLKTVDWELHVDREPATATPNGFKNVLGILTTATSVHLWLGGRIKWEQVRVPSTIRVKSGSELEEFIRQHNRHLDEEKR